MMAYLKAGIVQEFEQARSVGYLRRTEVNEPMQQVVEDDDNPFRSPASPTSPRQSANYVPTIKGAYMMAWNELWPFVSLIRTRHYRRARRLLAEAGFEA